MTAVPTQHDHRRAELSSPTSGFNVAAAVEVEPHAIESHIVNFPSTVHIQKDVMTLNGELLLQLAGIQQRELTGIVGAPYSLAFMQIGSSMW